MSFESESHVSIPLSLLVSISHVPDSVEKKWNYALFVIPSVKAIHDGTVMHMKTFSYIETLMMG